MPNVRYAKHDGERGIHRDEPIEAYVDTDGVSVGGIHRIVFLVKGAWIIGCCYGSQEDSTPDIGPFDTPELAWSTLQLLKD
jgi:hypothetical protein